MPSYPFIEPDWGRGVGRAVDQGFDAVMQGLAQRQQNKIQMLGLAGQMGGANPANVMAGQEISQQMEAGKVPFSAGVGPGGVPQDKQPIDPKQAGLYGEFQNFLGSMRGQAQQKQQMGQAGLEKTQAEAEWYKNRPTGPTDTIYLTDEMAARPELKSLGYKAGMSVPKQMVINLAKPSSSQQSFLNKRGTPEWDSMLEKVYKGKGKIMPDDIFRGMNQQARSFFISDLLEKHPDYNLASAQAERKQLMAEAQRKGSYGWRISTAANAVDRNLKNLEAMFQEPDMASIAQAEPFVAALRRGDASLVQDPKAKAMLTTLITTAYEEATVESGGYAPNEAAQHDMRNMLADGLTADGFFGVQSALTQTNINRLQAMDNPWEMPEMPTRGGKTLMGTKTQSKQDDETPESIKAMFQSGKIDKAEAKKRLKAHGYE